MKKLLFLSALIIHSSLLLFNTASAQAPSGFTYQSVLRDANNDLIINTAVGTQISILQTTAGGTAVYVETHTASTNANGLLTLQVGAGSAQSGTFASIDWSAGPYFIKSETDPAGGTTYTITGTQQMMSVPYALYAQSSGSGSNVNWTLNSGDITAVGTTDVIATSSLGVGNDLTSGFDFGANTIVLRENNTRILFEDSSTPGGTFPSTDWRLTANDQANGGENYFSIDNVTDTLVGIKVKVNGTLAIPTPGAQLGIGTDNPALSIHAKSGNTPSIRLEQDVSGGYSSEIWDIIANEVTFAVRNSSRLPFKISPDAQENSLVVTSTGVGVGTQNPLADLHVNGSLLARQATIDTIYSTSGLPLRLMARGIVAGSTGSTAPGQYASAMGYETTASGKYSIAMGSQTTASEWYSTAMGSLTSASGLVSTAMGNSTTASGYYSTAMGEATTAPSYAETAIGRYNTTYTPASTTAWNTVDRLFVVGNGTGTGANSSNALTITKDGTMNINDAYDMPTADGTAGQVMTTNGNGVVSFADPETVVTAGTNVTITGTGTVGDPYVVNATPLTCGLSIGDTYQGGIIFYVDASGCHGLIAAPSDQSTGIQWYNGSNSVTNAVRDGIGAGEFNTERIIANQATGAYAAQICANYQGGNYGDWYLPSKYELDLMYRNIGPGNALGLGNIGGFAWNYYWSSTEFDFNNAWNQNFNYGLQNYFNKNNNNYVRAVRGF